jgi:hypothetical protein
MLDSTTSLILQNVILPLVITLSTLIIDRKWYGKQAYDRAFSRALSLGVDSKRHPEKVTLEALFMAAEAELEYDAEQMNKDYKIVEKELEDQIEWWIFNDERQEEINGSDEDHGGVGQKVKV